MKLSDLPQQFNYQQSGKRIVLQKMSVTLFYRHQWVSRRYSSGKVGNDNLSAYSCATDPCAEKDKVQSSLARD